ncbi:MAG: ASKHA domain-containing protein [Desulfurispora sp.]|uniref:ASKHA domain-containing protein n=1 Tax=Desulfurispora sp. TaxID=3014275 RepID=UPI0040496CA2
MVKLTANQTLILWQGQADSPPLDPPVKKIYLELEPPALEDNRSDTERLRQAINRHWPRDVHIPLSLLREPLSDHLRQEEWRVTATLSFDLAESAPLHLVDVEPGDTTASLWGLAVDIGTTTVVAYLISLHDGRVRAVAADFNGQGPLGEDILTRIGHAANPAGLQELQQAILMTLQRLVERLAQEAGIHETQIKTVAIAANTTMVHLLLGLDPSRICLAPYIPVTSQPDLYSAAEIGLPVHPRAPVYIFPAVGSYVGGDIIAGILASGLHQRPEVSLFVDIGTNGEIVLGNQDWLVACAGAAGPALEGGVVQSGMRAEPGAIEKVRIDPATGAVTYSTIEGKAPVGICGSGLVDCLAQLLLAGIINRAGKFKDGRDKFVLVPAAQSATGQEIVITQTDINSLLRTKGAVNAAVELLLESVGLTMPDIEYFYAAGAFGHYLDVESAVTIGLYPDLPRDKIIRLGNSAGAGARLALLSRQARREALRIASSITYFELNANQVFMNKFVGSRFLPHTHLEYYPTVREKLARRGLLTE